MWKTSEQYWMYTLSLYFHANRLSHFLCLSPSLFLFDVKILFFAATKFVSRFCAKDQIDVQLRCDQEAMTKEARCKIYSTDGCSGAAQYGPTFFMGTILMAVAKNISC